MAHICIHNGILLNGTSRFGTGGILIHANKIVDIFNEKRFQKKVFPEQTQFIDVHGSYIAPGFIDTHIHGTLGFGTDSIDERAILKLSEVLPQIGVTSFCPTLYPRPIPQMNQKLESVVAQIDEHRNLDYTQRGSNILGIHMEGPFISTKRLGVHKPESASMPDMNAMQHFIKISKGYISNMTVAPELKGMHEIALLASNHKIVLQAGHTDAEYENIMDGIQVGILHSTHFFNAMSRLHHRNPGTVGAILLHPEMSCEIIADGIHVDPNLIKLLLRNKSIDKIVLITDALTPTMQAEKPYIANDTEVELKDGIFYTEEGTIAGSSLTMLQGVKNLINWGIPIEDAIRMSSTNPANILHFSNKGSLIPGYDADIVVLNQDIDIEYTIINGHIKYKK